MLGFPSRSFDRRRELSSFSAPGLASITWTIFQARRNAPNCEECGRRFLQSASLISSGLAIENSRNCYGTGAIVSASAERVGQANRWPGLPLVETDLSFVGTRRLAVAVNRLPGGIAGRFAGGWRKIRGSEPAFARSAQGIAERVRKNG